MMYSMVEEPHLTVLFSLVPGKGIQTGTGGARVIKKWKAYHVLGTKRVWLVKCSTINAEECDYCFGSRHQRRK